MFSYKAMRTRLLGVVDFMGLVETLIVKEQRSLSMVSALLGQLPNQIVEELDVLFMRQTSQVRQLDNNVVIKAQILVPQSLVCFLRCPLSRCILARYQFA